MKKILILGANSYIGTSFHNYLTTKYPGQYQTDIVSLRGIDWKNRDWSGYDSVMNVAGKAHADISSLTEEQKQEYYAINCDLAVEVAKRSLQTVPHSMSTSAASLSTETAVTVGNRSGSRRIRSRLLPIFMETANGRRNRSCRNCSQRKRPQGQGWQSYASP